MQINSLEPSGNPAAFIQYVIPHITAVVIRVPWSSVETAPGVFSFTSLDNHISNWTKHGVKVNVLFELVSEGVIRGGQNTSTPPWVLDKVTITNCGLPVVYESGFSLPAHVAVAMTLKHLAGKINYFRTGFVEGGENTLVCLPFWSGWNQQAFLDYIKSWCVFLSPLPADPRVVVCASDTLAHQEAALANASHLGMGNSALGVKLASYEKSIFGQYGADFLYFQTLSASTPNGGDPRTGSLVDIIPLAKELKASALELYSEDLLAAYDPTYPTYTELGAAYRAALSQS